MISVRRGEERGLTELDWLKSWHTFSFGDYHDDMYMGFRSLRVLNDDVIAPGRGFGAHPHRDMEIVTLVLSGALRHQDSTGAGSVMRPGCVQRMSAGRGVTHSEWNDSNDEPVHLLQIWLFPEQRGLAPSYEEKRFSRADLADRLRVVAAKHPNGGAVKIHQDAALLFGRFAPGSAAAHSIPAGRHAFLHVATGRVKLGATTLYGGDAAAFSDEREVAFTAEEESQVLLFDLA